MFAVIFEVQPRAERREDYLALGRFLKPELEKIDGFIANERFADVDEEGHVLSLSLWRDEKALIRWRTLAVHHGVQEKGRSEIFRNYRLRVGEIAVNAGTSHWQRSDETESGDAKVVTLTDMFADADGRAPDVGGLGLPEIGTEGVIDRTLFRSLYTPGGFLVLVSWRDVVAAGNWKPGEACANHRCVRIIRDYGMFDRHEAPQYYPAV
jgi:heme-degrading monooxygenase HmoA